MKSIIDIEMRFSDFDIIGHVHNSRYLCYFEQGRMDLLSKIAGKDWNWKKRGLILGRNEIDYLKPIYIKDLIYIITKCENVGNKSFTLFYEVFKKSKEQDILCTKGRSILICTDYETNTSVPVFDSWKISLLNSIDK